jgi:hypothetical protein
MTTDKIKRHKSLETDQIPAELIKAGDRTFRYEIHKLINLFWNKEELPEEWKESNNILMYRMGNKTDYSNYRGISHLSPAYKMLSNIMFSSLTLYAEEINGGHQCGFRRNRSTTDQYSAFIKYFRKM